MKRMSEKSQNRPLTPSLRGTLKTILAPKSLLIRGLVVVFALGIWLIALPSQADILPASPPVTPPVQAMAKPSVFSNTSLKQQDFSGQDLRASDFVRTNLTATNFSGADLRGCTFSAAEMLKTNLQGADLAGAMLDQVRFIETDLSDAILEDAILLRASFDGVKITGADFTGAVLDGFQAQSLCQVATGVNSRTGVATRESLGCKGS
jgi:uncharacterized protein YjbI with pentapeptide repeats